MKNFLRICLIAIIGAFAFSNLYYVSEFDGQWRADISTEDVKCIDGFALDLQILKGQINGVVFGKDQEYQLQGEVDSGGRFHINVIGINKKGLSGVFRGNSGEATWNFGKCSGSLITFKK